MRVFVTGGTGFVGRKVVEQLLAAGHQATALVRPSQSRKHGALPDAVQVVVGDVLDPDLAHAMSGSEAVIHLVGIIRAFPSKGITFEKLHVQATSNVVRAMKQMGIRRIVHMSALGAAPEASTDYFRTKGVAEQMVMESSLDWTVIRPSVIAGEGAGMVDALAGQVKAFPVVPVIGDGAYRLQPVWVGDVARGFVDALTRQDTVGRDYDVGGPDQLAYDQVLDQIAQAMGKPRGVAKLHFPLGLMLLVIRALEWLSFFPVTSDQVAMLTMSNVCDSREYFETFHIEPKTFAQTMANAFGSDRQPIEPPAEAASMDQAA